METDKKLNTRKIGAMLVILLLVAGFYLYMDNVEKTDKEVLNNGDIQATTTDSVGVDNDLVMVDADGNVVKNAKVELISVEPEGTSPVLPTLDREIVVPASFEVKVRNQVIENINSLKSDIRANPASVPLWVNLATHWRIIADYKASRDVWAHLVVLIPDNFLPYLNLADIYAYDLKDPVRALDNYKLALFHGKNQPSVYFGLYDFYINVQKDPVKAKEAISLGVENNPNDADLAAKLKTL